MADGPTASYASDARAGMNQWAGLDVKVRA